MSILNTMLNDSIVESIRVKLNTNDFLTLNNLLEHQDIIIESFGEWNLSVDYDVNSLKSFISFESLIRDKLSNNKKCIVDTILYLISLSEV